VYYYCVDHPRGFATRGIIGMAIRNHQKTTLLLAALLVTWLGASHAAPIRIEAEAYADSLNVGGAGIQALNAILYGLDYPGDWTGYDLATTDFGLYKVSMHVWGAAGVSYQIRLIAEDADENERVLDFYFTGQGTCGH
jgi:hypothetical protein